MATKPTLPPPTPQTGSQTIDTPSTTSTTGYKPAAVGAGASKTKSIPRFSKSIDRPDFNTTQFITNNIYQNLMGRDATAAEIAKCHQAYTQYAATHPTNTGSSMLDTTSGVDRQSTSINTGTNEQSFIANLVNGSAESKAYTSATTYMDAIQSYINKSRGLY